MTKKPKALCRSGEGSEEMHLIHYSETPRKPMDADYGYKDYPAQGPKSSTEFFSKKQNGERKNGKDKRRGSEFSRECPGFQSEQMDC